MQHRPIRLSRPVHIIKILGICCLAVPVMLLAMLYLYIHSYQSNTFGNPARLLIPDGYIGKIKLEYGVAGAPPLQQEGGYDLYTIPPGGHFQTSTLRHGITYGDFYYVKGQVRKYLHNDAYTLENEGPYDVVVRNAVMGETANGTFAIEFSVDAVQQRESENHPYSMPGEHRTK